MLRLPDGDPAKGETLHQAVEPGQRERVLALIRNQSGIVDNYDLRVEGMPEDWWSIYPGTVYLVPFGSGGTYEQEVEIHLHPPRAPGGRGAGVGPARSSRTPRRSGVEAASAPLALHIAPYIETTTTLRPQRKKGRRKADFDVTVTNKANAPVLVALEGEDPDGELQFGFNRPPQEIPPGGAVDVEDARQARPSRSGSGARATAGSRCVTVTGDEAAERAAAEPLAAAGARAAPRRRDAALPRRRAPRVPGVYPPRVYKPQIYAAGRADRAGRPQRPHAAVPGPAGAGPADGLGQRASMARGKMKMPGRGGGRRAAGAAAADPGRLPPEAVDPVVADARWRCCSCCCCCSTSCFPHNVGRAGRGRAEVGVRGREEADRSRISSSIPTRRPRSTTRSAAGTIIGQTPAAGRQGQEGLAR